MAENMLMPIGQFVLEIEKAYKRGDGYIMGATGQNPRKWATTSWWFTQYNDDSSAKAKALYWRENAERVWDCNGLAEGIYKDFSGVDINTKARYNYANWCSPKGTGMIPEKMRVPGAAVFWGDTAGSITHVAYLYKPVKIDNPTGDWYLIEAAGVKKGVVMTKLLTRKPRYWGYMTKYFDYSNYSAYDWTVEEPVIKLGDRTLKQGCEGDDVKEMQEMLLELGYDLGKWGADGDFGDCTEIALNKFKKSKKLPQNGELNADELKILLEAYTALEKPVTNPTLVLVDGGSVYVRTAPSTATGKVLGLVHRGDKLPYAGCTDENGWNKVKYNEKDAWISGKYSKLLK